MLSPQFRFIISMIVFVLIGLGIGYFLFVSKIAPTVTKDCEKYPFINKDIDCGVINQEATRIKDIDIGIRKIIDEEIMKKHITRASVFYRDLNTRQWFGINDTANFYAASLLKLPLSIIYFKLAEIDPNVLDEKFLIPKDQLDRNIPDMFMTTSTFIPGREYTITQLIEGMLIYSDNNPVPILNEHVDTKLRLDVLHDLGIEPSKINSSTPENTINVRIYSNILRFLYNSSFLRLEYSNLLLEHLSETTFTAGIVSGIPQDIPVAHKFGEATKFDPNGKVESRILHDCGIVYNPTKPYIICIMTEGKEFVDMAHVIQRITEETYQL